MGIFMECLHKKLNVLQRTVPKGNLSVNALLTARFGNLDKTNPVRQVKYGCIALPPLARQPCILLIDFPTTVPASRLRFSSVCLSDSHCRRNGNQ